MALTAHVTLAKRTLHMTDAHQATDDTPRISSGNKFAAYKLLLSQHASLVPAAGTVKTRAPSWWPLDAAVSMPCNSQQL